MKIIEIFSDWIAVVTLQKSFVALKKEKHTLSEGLINILLSSFIFGAIIATFIFLMGANMPAYSQPGSNLVMALLVLILFPILMVVAWLINAGIIYLLARLFNGKGTFGGFATMLSYIVAPNLVLSWIPLVGFVFAMWAIILSIMAVRDYFKLSAVKATLVVFLPVIVLMVFVMFSVLIFFIAGAAGMYGY